MSKVLIVGVAVVVVIAGTMVVWFHGHALWHELIAMHHFTR